MAEDKFTYIQEGDEVGYYGEVKEDGSREKLYGIVIHPLGTTQLLVASRKFPGLPVTIEIGSVTTRPQLMLPLTSDMSSTLSSQGDGMPLPFQVRVVIVRNIWQKLSNVESEVTRIVTHFWQLFHTYVAKPRVSSRIFDQPYFVS